MKIRAPYCRTFAALLVLALGLSTGCQMSAPTESVEELRVTEDSPATELVVVPGADVPLEGLLLELRDAPGASIRAADGVQVRVAGDEDGTLRVLITGASLSGVVATIDGLEDPAAGRISVVEASTSADLVDPAEVRIRVRAGS